MRYYKLFVVFIALFVLAGCTVSEGSDKSIPEPSPQTPTITSENTSNATTSNSQINEHEPTPTSSTSNTFSTVEVESTEAPPASIAESVPNIPIYALPGINHRLGILYGKSRSTGDSGWYIFAADIPNGIATPITSASGLYTELRWSPDGNNVAYITEPADDRSRTLYTAKADGSGVVKIADLVGYGTYQWSPDSTQLAATVYFEPDQPGQLLLVDAEDGKQRSLFQLEQGFSSDFVWSSDGTQIFMSSIGLNSQVYAVSVVDGTMIPTASDMRINLDPAWSPDGVNYAHHCGRPPRNLCVQSENQEREQKLYRLPDDEDKFAWNPDVPKHKRQSVWITDFVWSPDGEYLAINWEFDFESTLCVFEFSNPENRQCFISVDLLLESILWSPDGQYLAFTAPMSAVYKEDSPNNGTGLFIVDIDSGEVFLLTYAESPYELSDFYWLD